MWKRCKHQCYCDAGHEVRLRLTISNLQVRKKLWLYKYLRPPKEDRLSREKFENDKKRCKECGIKALHFYVYQFPYAMLHGDLMSRSWCGICAFVVPYLIFLVEVVVKYYIIVNYAKYHPIAPLARCLQISSKC